MHTFHLDAEQAFVQGNLDTDIYMKMPDGCGTLPEKILFLNKSVNALKQPAQAWFDFVFPRSRKMDSSNVGPTHLFSAESIPEAGERKRFLPYT